MIPRLAAAPAAVARPRPAPARPRSPPPHPLPGPASCGGAHRMGITPVGEREEDRRERGRAHRRPAAAWGVHRVYGYPGDGIGGVIAALGTAADDVEFVQVRHEETAGFAATADVKYGGSALGCCVVTSGPGRAARAQRRLRRVPRPRARGGRPRPDRADRARRQLLPGGRPAQRLQRRRAGLHPDDRDPAQVEHMVDRACRTALASARRRCSSCRATSRSRTPCRRRRTRTATTTPARSRAPARPARRDLQRAADVLNAGEKVALLVGAGALGHSAGRGGRRPARRGRGQGAAGQARARRPARLGHRRDRPARHHGSWNLMRDCDTLLIVGSNDALLRVLPGARKARAVQIDIDGSRAAALPDRGQPRRRRRRHAHRAAAAAGRRPRRRLARRRRRLEAPLGRLLGPARRRQGPPGQPRGGRPRDLRPAGRRRHDRRRLRHRHQLVRPRHRAAPDADGQPGRAAAVDGRRHAATRSPPRPPTPTARCSP